MPGGVEQVVVIPPPRTSSFLVTAVSCKMHGERLYGQLRGNSASQLWCKLAADDPLWKGTKSLPVDIIFAPELSADKFWEDGLAISNVSPWDSVGYCEGF